MSPGVPGAETLIMSGSIITPDTDTSPDAVTRMLSTRDTITLHTAALKRALDTGGHSGHNSLYRVTQQTPVAVAEIAHFEYIAATSENPVLVSTCTSE